MKANNVKITIEIESIEDLDSKFELPIPPNEPEEFISGMKTADLFPSSKVLDGVLLRLNDPDANITFIPAMPIIFFHQRFNCIPALDAFLSNYFGFKDLKNNCLYLEDKTSEGKSVYIRIDKNYKSEDSIFIFWRSFGADEYEKKYPLVR